MTVGAAAHVVVAGDSAANMVVVAFAAAVITGSMVVGRLVVLLMRLPLMAFCRRACRHACLALHHDYLCHYDDRPVSHDVLPSYST